MRREEVIRASSVEKTSVIQVCELVMKVLMMQADKQQRKTCAASQAAGREPQRDQRPWHSAPACQGEVGAKHGEHYCAECCNE